VNVQARMLEHGVFQQQKHSIDNDTQTFTAASSIRTTRAFNKPDTALHKPKPTVTTVHAIQN